MDEEGKNLKFDLPPLNAETIRPGGGLTILQPIGLFQMIAAVRAYNGYASCRDWMEKLSTTYVVAIATRSADTLLMQHIQEFLNETLRIECKSCIDSSIGHSIIRERLFPDLKEHREHANDLLHHLDSPKVRGINGLNIEGVYAYCHRLFHGNIDALFGRIPNPSGKFAHSRCKKCRST